MKAVLMMPSFRGNRFGGRWVKNGAITPPLGLLYVAGSLERARFKVRVLDFNVECVERDEFCRSIREADVAGISVLSATSTVAKELIADVRSINPDVKVICGGPHINVSLKPFPGADVTFMGEAEETAGEVCRLLAVGDVKRLSDFRGLWLQRNGAAVKTGPPVVIQDLNRSPGPARSYIDPRRYGELVGIRVAWRIAAMDSSRGCPYRCSFCVRRGIHRYRHRDAANVVDEVEQIASAGHDLLVFNEDNFAALPGRALDIMREIKRRGIRIRIMLQTRVDAINEDLISAFREAGVWALILGIESANQEILDFYEKGTTVEQGRRVVELADRAGIFTYGFFLVGAPAEREDHLRENVRFITQVPLDFVGFNILDYQRGSKLWAQEVRRGGIRPEETVAPTGRRFGALPYDELERAVRSSYRAFYLRPGLYWRILKKCLRARDFTLLGFLLRFSLKLFSRFRMFALTEEPPTVAREIS